MLRFWTGPTRTFLVLVALLALAHPVVAGGGKLQIGGHGGIAFSSESEADNRYPFGAQVSYYFLPSVEAGLYAWVALDEEETLGTTFTSSEIFIGAEANYHLRGLPGPFFRRLHVGAKVGNAIRGIDEEGSDPVTANAFSYAAEVGWTLRLPARLSVGIDGVWMYMPKVEETIERDSVDVTYTFAEVSYTSLLLSLAIRL